MDKQPFVTTLTAEPSYKLGTPILITFAIKNTGNEAYQLLNWGTPLEGHITANCFTVQYNGEVIPYDGKFVKRGDPLSEAYVVIQPNKVLKEVVDISGAYAIDQVGDYTVTLNATLFDAFALPGKAKKGPRKRQNHQPHKLTSTSVQFKVVDGAKARLTEGQAARKASKLADSSARAPSFNGGTDNEHAEVIIAHNNAQYFAALAVSQLKTTLANTNALYQTWFGAFDQSRYDTVTKIYGEISDTLLTEQVTYDLSGTDCESDWNAYTYNGVRTVWICNNFWSMPPIAIDCQFSTILHEWSHAAGDTDDYVYGDAACQTLANNHPADAIDNADTYENFAERLAQSDFGKSITFVTDRSTFGKDEIDTMLAQSSPALIAKAFYVFADGFWPDRLGITSASLGTALNVKPTITISPNVAGMTIIPTSLEAEDTALPAEPQRFTWIYNISFANTNGFPANPGGISIITLAAAIAGLSNSAQIQLIREPNPYELDGQVSWLSTDLRVFQVRAGESRFNATMGSTQADASTFIKKIVVNLNTGSTGGQSFDGISTDAETSALELAGQVMGAKVFNFALAKVRYIGSTDISNVRVFFRLFPAATTSTNFDQNTTYRRSTQGSKVIPLLGMNANGDLLTIPFFAEPRVNTAAVSLTTQTDPTNVRTIAHVSGGREALAYFGCWLDINQTQLQFPTKPALSDGPWTSGQKSILELMRNVHQCLVAEIAFDPDPIPPSASPSGSDKLAQRNLVIVESANPGNEFSRRILTTFDLRPVNKNSETGLAPDELLIDWGNTPSDSLATVYIPEVHAGRILALADACYGNHKLKMIDDQTLQLPVGGISYVPLPQNAAIGLTGLLSVDLPASVHKGEVYTIVVRQLTNTVAKRIQAVEIEQTHHLDARASSAQVSPALIYWKRITGSYQISIPVHAKETILPREMRLLSVLRWILKSVPKDDRWYPVFNKYVTLIGERVNALGGDASLVEASPSGSGGELEPAPGEVLELTRNYDGKVTGLIYDCYGDFEGFQLDVCGKEIVFHAREHRIEALVHIAWHERIAITVVTGSVHPHRPINIILRHAPEPFQG